MKIALVSFLVENGGGASAVVQMLAKHLRSKRIELIIITSCPKKTVSVTAERGVKIYCIPPSNLYWVGEKGSQPIWKRAIWQAIDSWNPLVYRSVKEILRLEKPDIVHVHKLRGISPAVWSAAAESGAKIIQTCHDYELFSPEGTLTGPVGKLSSEGHPVVRPYQKYRARLSNLVSLATAPSLYTLGRHTAKGFFKHAGTQVIPNSHGLTLAELRESTKNIRNGGVNKRTVNFLYLGRLEQTKGIHLLCEAFRNCASHIDNIELDVAGYGSLEFQLKERYSGSRRIRFVGMVRGNRKREVLNNADIVVVPSIWEEVFGIVIVESYTHGKPVLATCVGGIPEIVKPYSNGYLIPPEDIQAMEEYITRIAEHPKEVYDMSGACLDAAEEYTLDVIGEKYFNLYVTGIES